ncbi:MAG: hypothetical protein U0Q07_06365 [Acidimicrobiales bacterium]
MLVSCWSAKGGAGTTVVAAALALTAALDDDAGSLLVDLAGDAPAVLGVPEPDGPGAADWLAAGPEVPVDALARLEVEVGGDVSLIPWGRRPPGADAEDRAEVLAALLAGSPRSVVVDCGRIGHETDPVASVRRTLAAAGTHSLLVTRGCYLALRHAVQAPLRPSAVVLVDEPGRSLGRLDVEAVVGAPVVARVPWDAGVARAVDAGLLVDRLPRGLARALRHAA